MPTADRLPLSVWAPRAERVRLLAGGRELSMRPGVGPDDGPSDRPEDEGWWVPAEPLPADLGDEFDYGYLLDDETEPTPDPRSRWQPEGVHGLSRTFDPSRYAWSDGLWKGRQLPGGVIYEMHVGTFTPEGTLDSAIERLDHLAELGIDFVELLPVNAYNGEHGWGYDGVLWYAVHHSYGGPAAYQRFVDACHQRGLGVIQDVVYNHLGPSGNYLPKFAPYFSEGGQNTWGDSINLDGEESDEVRRYIIENAHMWLRDYHVDGLRLDAVHALLDTRAIHVLEELAIETEALSTFLGRPLTLIAESDLNDPRLITSREGGGYGLNAQWSDDFHHALYVSLTGDTSGYYADFESLAALGKVFESGFFHDGTRSSFRGRGHGMKIDTLRTPTWRLVVCQDNHDQIGNRADGQRLSGKLDHQQLRLAALVTLLSPFTPMIFMGEEWGAATPWQFFTSHPEPELAEAVAKGRLEEFAQMDWDPEAVADPQDPETFARSKLDWSELDRAEHAELLAFNRELLRLRRRYPDISDPRFDRALASADDEHDWLVIERGEIIIAVNFSGEPAELEVPEVQQVLLTVGGVEVDGGAFTLPPHGALVARIDLQDRERPGPI
ncbi:maltooligosyltrehalose trehalohydrolase [Friedmanniella endophytica]|uniref:Malto-oligosyltrehalose trehalohydrolase n=1 Tax=Microlunatus kandeliicorticis TaxID=1759536 RepID=A0A7W3IPV7_9ACTN|nr:malto-oligosyltrehalose trehalohydrolase [Microlunatus kandeliicorticis]MBA8793046.1 maltooligosyltrehalose trehalohydrolase [Microlunatus kandeliicorticis]